MSRFVEGQQVIYRDSCPWDMKDRGLDDHRGKVGTIVAVGDPNPRYPLKTQEEQRYRVSDGKKTWWWLESQLMQVLTDDDVNAAIASIRETIEKGSYGTQAH